jgi:hypothetical protein
MALISDINDKRWKFLCVVAFYVGTLGCTALDERTIRELEAAYGSSAPTIETAFASETTPPRSIWKIYLNGSDPDGDIRDIKIWAEVPWYTIPVTFTTRSSQGKTLSGYIEFDTLWFLNFAPSWLRVQVMLMDRANHKSELIEFQTELSALAKPESPPEGMFQDITLGSIPVEQIPPVFSSR